MEVSFTRHFDVSKRELLYHKYVDNDVYASNSHKYNKIAKRWIFINHVLEARKQWVKFITWATHSVKFYPILMVCKTLVNWFGITHTVNQANGLSR